MLKMSKFLRLVFVTSLLLTLCKADCFAGVEPYENFIKGKIKRKDTLIVKDEKFKNPKYNWGDITNISVKNSIAFRLLDQVAIKQNFTAQISLRVEYLSRPDQASPEVKNVELNLNYSAKKGARYKINDTYNFSNAYWIRVIVDNIYSPEFQNDLPANFQLTAGIIIDRQYAFKPATQIKPDASFVSGKAVTQAPKRTIKSSMLASINPLAVTGNAGPGIVLNNGNQLQLTWAVIPGAEEYDVEWTTANSGNPNYGLIGQMSNGTSGNVDPAVLDNIFLHNATRITTNNQNYLLSLVYNDDYLLVRMRQVQYTTDGIRLLGDWDYKLGSGQYAVWSLSWYQQNLNWQYSAAFAEEGKKKEVVSYFDGSLRSRQTVTLNNSDNVAVAQESLYDEFGRPTASVLPAPYKEAAGATPYLRYLANYNRNAANTPYSYANIAGSVPSASCEFNPDSLNVTSGASQYYSAQNPFKNDKTYDAYIPDAQGYPLSVTEYTADNTGRIKVQGGVGKTFQPGKNYPSKTTRYYYAKPEQWELDRIFGNDAGDASHYLKNMVADPNGQMSISYVNASGKTVATALTGPVPATMDSISTILPATIQTINLLDSSKFIFDNAALKIKATTTHLVSVTGKATMAYSIQKLIDQYPGGASAICSNCYYDLTIKVLNDCNTPIYTTTTPIQLGSLTSNCNGAGVQSDSLQVNFPQIGEYYFSFELAFSKTVMENYVNNFVTQGLQNGYLKNEFSFILPYLDALDYRSCLSDCQTCEQTLGTQPAFVQMFQSKLVKLDVDSATVYGPVFTTWVNNKYNTLKTFCDSLSATCNVGAAAAFSACDQYEQPMLDDVSPGGQYALFDSSGNPLETATNVISNYWRTEFPVLTPDPPQYQAEQITLADGTITSPYDQNFTLALFVQYFKTDWASKFLKYHPEYCKLQFCQINSNYESWDQNIQDNFNTAASIPTIPDAPAGLQYDHTNAGWLVAADPYFQTGGPGAAYSAAMQNDLQNYTLNVLKVKAVPTKSLTGFIDFLTYCGDPSVNTNTQVNSYNNWDQCSPDPSCRVLDREWMTYKDSYFELKKKYYDTVRNATTCANTCPVGMALSLPPASPCPVTTDFLIADYSSADGHATVTCSAPLKTVVLSYTPGKVLTPATVNITYASGVNAAGLPTSFQFAAGDSTKTFCIPQSIPVETIAIQSIICQACQANPLVFNTWTNDHIIQNLYDANGNIVSTQTLTRPDADYLSAKITIRPDNTYQVTGICTPYSGNWDMDASCNFALYNNDIKYSLSSINNQQLVLKHKEGSLEEIWYFNGTGNNTVNCSNPAMIAAASTAGNNSYYTGTYPSRHLLTLIPGVSTTVPGYSCTNSLNQSSPSTSTYYTCLTVTTADNGTSVNYNNVWAFDCLYDNVPANCPQSLLTKESRFYDVNTNFQTENTASLVQQNTTAVAQQTQTSASNAADGWMASLAPGLGSYSATAVSNLRAALIDIATKGGDLDHPFGASSVAPGQTTVSGYLNFGDAIKGVLGLSNFTSSLNPWLISSPYPYSPKMQATFSTITSSNADICSLLQQYQSQCDAYNSAHGTGLSLFNYLTQVYGTAMSLSAADLQTLQNSCGQCRFLLAYDLTLPVFLEPNAKGCVLPSDYSAAKAALNAQFGGSLSINDPNYETIFTNFMNQRWGFVLGYSQYLAYETQLSTNPSAMLCNQVPPGITPDPLACISTQIAISVANGKRDYGVYIEQQKDLFRASYVNTCSAAKGNVVLKAPEKIYHYTLYYYDQADNLMGTVPPEGVQLLTDAQLQGVHTYRYYYTNADSLDIYNSGIVSQDTTAALTSLGNTLSSPNAAGQAIELWLYNTGSGAEQVLAASANRNYLLQTCINGSQLGVDVYILSHSDTTAVTVSSAKHFTYNITAGLPLQTWQHVVLQSTSFLTDTIRAFVNGRPVPVVANVPNLGCSFTLPPGINPPQLPLNLNYVKQLRFYNRLLSQQEISTNAASAYFLPSNTVGLAWYRFNVPAPGSPTTTGAGSTDELKYAPVYPAHRLITTYAYNSTNQVTQQQSPDGGINRFWYDLLSRLVISQNDKQLAAGNYSYTNYDILGRITEVGQKNQNTVNLNAPDYLTSSTIGSFYAAGSNSQITNTYYDVAAPAANGIQSVSQDNLRKRVAASTYRDSGTGQVQQATYYNYDLDGNVKTLYQQIAGLDMKKIDYEYDLVSGKVNFVSYQNGQPDQFYYKYNYDADNRITEAWTGTQATVFPYGGSYLLNGKMDASYQYYLHGPLARVELGDVNGKVQGLDYAYTLQGWMKGVNRTISRFRPTETTDMGNDGSNGVAVDAFNYNLYYYPNDYQPIGGVNPFDQLLESQPDYYPLYNGNIAGMAQTMPAIDQPTVVNSYRYDQLNRITANLVHQNNLPYTLPPYDTMDETFSYDGNGNILKSFRHGDFYAAPKDMDDLTYNYNRDGNGNLINNKLRHVNDAIPYYADNDGQDLHDQVPDNYRYDPIGNLVQDQQAAISNIDWTVYGKIKGITKTDGPNITYNYDPAGQRASKISNGITTWYVRDAQGNTMAVYDNKGNGVNWREQDLYGSSRLGIWQPNVSLSANNASAVWDTVGHKTYELSNHLGNVLATITDKRIAHSTDGTTVDYYDPEISTSQEYFAFGMLIQNRNFTLNGVYRYGFNGKENDNEVKLDFDGNNINGAQQDYGMRIYDPRLGRFLSTDPLTSKYPMLTPYQFASNSPIKFIDLDGKEAEGEGETEAMREDFERERELEELHRSLKTPTNEEREKQAEESMKFWRRNIGRIREVLRDLNDNLVENTANALGNQTTDFKQQMRLYSMRNGGGSFVVRNFKDVEVMSQKAWFKYQGQINGISGDIEYAKNGIRFDGFNGNALLEAKGNYQWLFASGKTTRGEIYTKMQNQLREQVDAARGGKLEWHFAEQTTLNEFKSHLSETTQGQELLKKIELIYTKPTTN
jgi:RHS repeat-associated protein